MNCDVLTNVNFSELLNFHNSSESSLTICCREYSYQIPYGVVNADKFKVLGIDEKPEYKFKVNAGIYVVNPPTLELLEKNKKMDMTCFISRLIKRGYEVSTFPIHEYWIDIGQVHHLEKANVDYQQFL